MRILIAGSSGLIGKELITFLRKQGHTVIRLVRREPETDDELELKPSVLEGFDAIINLAGANIFRRWTKENKELIRKSRIDSTRLLVEAINQLKNPPRVLINSSGAIGIYENRGREVLTEESSMGSGFLAKVCFEWEASTDSLRKEVRKVILRTGLVLTPKGGALKKMLFPFRMGLGGVLGSGEQYMSWIAMDDFLEVVLECLKNTSLSGPVNVVSPNPVTNREFTKALGKVLHRPTVFPISAFILRAIFGKEMAEGTLLESSRVKPKKLLEANFKFRYPELEGALRHLLAQK